MHLIGGQIRGLWDGTEGVVLRLEADGISTQLTASSDGVFNFEEQLATGTSYTVTVATNAAYHSCTLDGGDSGTVEDADILNVSVTCQGPTVAIALSGGWGWTFDPLQDSQMFSGSITAQEVGVTIRGNNLLGAFVAGTAVTLGVKARPISLPLGLSTLPVLLKAEYGLSKYYQFVFERGAALLEQVAYGKASNAGFGEQFGYSVALSGDTLAIGAPGETTKAGAVYVFTRTGTTWMQQARIKASNAGQFDAFGSSVALSGDTLAVGAPGEDSAAVVIGGDENNNSASDAGAVYVFVRSNGMWTKQAYVKASNALAGDAFGSAVALSEDTLAAGAPDRNTEDGAVYVFVRNSGAWMPQPFANASYFSNGRVGASIALSGNTLVVGAPGRNYGGDYGAVYVYARGSGGWNGDAYEIQASNRGYGDAFGYSVALSGDTLAVGAPHEDSADGREGDESAYSAGAVYVFARTGTTWGQQAYVKASNIGVNDLFGSSVALFSDTLAVGAPRESSSATKVDGNQADDNAGSAGAAYVFIRSGITWVQQAYVKASNTGAGDQFGSSVALSGDTLAIGASYEDSASTEINGDQTSNLDTNAGAVYVFR
jgi:hypothetical protein